MNAWRAVAILILALASPATFAQSGNEVLGWCKIFVDTKGNAFQSGRCLGFMEGGRQGLEFASYISIKLKALSKPSFCVPDGVTNGQLGQVLIQYFERHPAELHEPAVGLFSSALVEAFPCR